MIFHSTYSKPILLLGNGVRQAGALEMVHEFVKKTNIPVLTTMNGVDLAQDDMHIGFIGIHGNSVANLILNECDLVVSIGARLGIRQVGRDAKNFAPKADLVRCDIDKYELSRDIKANEKKFHTDARDFMSMLLDENVGDFWAWKSRCMKAKEYLSKYEIHPGNRIVKKISDMLPYNPVVAVDVGMNQCWCAQSLHLKGYQGRILIGGGYGSMGCGLPFAIGSSISINKGKVYCVCGDGGFQMNIQELETVKRERLPIKIFVLNNRALGMISEIQHFNCGDRFADATASGGYTVPDFRKISEAYGIKAVTLSSCEELDDYKDWFEDNDPCLFDISLPQESFIAPNAKFETRGMFPELDDNTYSESLLILR